MQSLPEIPISVIPRKVGRKLEWPEKWLGSFAAGTLARIDAVLAPKEDRRTFVREAVEREIKRRERQR